MSLYSKLFVLLCKSHMLATITITANGMEEVTVGPFYMRLCIIGSDPAAHTAAIYATRAKLKPMLFEG
jgi:thioredoxin reductase (NADPH)